MPQTKFCQGISDISDSYMGFVIDTWGVLHKGGKALDGVSDALKELKTRKKTVILLSNSPKRASEIKEDLKKAGIGPSLYTEIVSSGELIWKALNDETDGVINKKGKKCFLFAAKDFDKNFFDGLNVEIVNDISNADFLMISGKDPRFPSVEQYEKVLKEAARKGLHAICANPDSRALIGASYITGPGAISRRYKDFGGIVNFVGKPHSPIFKYCVDVFQKKGIYPGNVVMIGDTMAHDILGASNAMFDTCLVTTGMHSGNFLELDDLGSKDKTLNILMAQYNNIMPNFLLDYFIWGNALPDRKNKKKRVLKKRN